MDWTSNLSDLVVETIFSRDSFCKIASFKDSLQSPRLLRRTKNLEENKSEADLESYRRRKELKRLIDRDIKCSICLH